MLERGTANEILPGAREFLRDHLEGAKVKKPVRRYRFKHCLRAVSRGRQVAEEEKQSIAGYQFCFQAGNDVARRRF